MEQNITLNLQVPEINLILAALNGFTKPLVDKITVQAQSQIKEEAETPPQQ